MIDSMESAIRAELTELISACYKQCVLLFALRNLAQLPVLTQLRDYPVFCRLAQPSGVFSIALAAFILEQMKAPDASY